jgi:hypothetical protein
MIGRGICLGRLVNLRLDLDYARVDVAVVGSKWVSVWCNIDMSTVLGWDEKNLLRVINIFVLTLGIYQRDFIDTMHQELS